MYSITFKREKHIIASCIQSLLRNLSLILGNKISRFLFHKFMEQTGFIQKH